MQFASAVTKAQSKSIASNWISMIPKVFGAVEIEGWKTSSSHFGAQPLQSPEVSKAYILP
jgi:hypothetical protein